MNKNFLFTLSLAFIAALGGIFTANGQERKLLTMEDAILNPDLSPARVAVRWDTDAKGRTIYGISAPKAEPEWFYATNGKPAAAPAEVEKPATPRYFTEANNLYCEIDGQRKAITADTDTNIVNGSHVSRNEFGIVGGIFPSPDGLCVAFYRKDESQVSDYPLYDITTRTGSTKLIKYPMAGMPSEKVSVGVWDSRTEQTVWLDVTDFDQERYITNISWSPNGELIYAQVLARSQKELYLNSYDSRTGKLVERICYESDNRYVEPLYPLHFLSDDSFIYTTNVRDGYWNLYLYTRKKAGEQWSCRRLTEVDADVQYVGHDAKSVYYYSAEVSPAEQHLCKVDIKSGKRTRLTTAEGWHHCLLSPDKKWFIDNYSSLKVPRVVNVASTDGKKSREVFRADDPTVEYNYTPIELGSIKSADGLYDNHYRLIYPIDFDENKKYPAILYVYGGPHSQMVNNSFCANLRRWEMLMAQKGYVVLVMDNRGTQYHGAEYEKAIYGQCGKAEMEDQMKGIEWLCSHPWVDADRIGVHGWSYGGFMTISLMTTYPDVFKVGVAGGPVIDWKWYEVMYGERYMSTPQDNPEGYEATSLIGKAKDLQGKLLICQGVIDPVVVWQHSLSFVRQCVVEGKQVDYFPYPRHEHNVLGPDRVHLMNKVTEYFEDYLK